MAVHEVNFDNFEKKSELRDRLDKILVDYMRLDREYKIKQETLRVEYNLLSTRLYAGMTHKEVMEAGL